MRTAARTGVLVAFTALVAACVGGDDEPIGQVESFYLEAEVRVWSNAANVGTNVPTTGRPTESEGTVRWWSRSPGDFRQEIQATSDDGLEASTLILGSEGRLTFYRSAESRYWREAMPELPDGVVAFPIPSSIILGPPYHDGPERGFAAAVAMLEGRNNRPEGVVELPGERIAGRETRLFEWGHAGCSATTLVGGAELETECTGALRTWVDAETGFILRYESEDPGVQRVEVRVTRIDYSPVFDDALFRFEPPPGAVESP